MDKPPQVGSRNWEFCSPLLGFTSKNNRTSAHSFQHDSLHIYSFSVISQPCLSKITVIIHTVRLFKGFTERVKKCTGQALNILNFGVYTRVRLLKSFVLTLTGFTGAIFTLILNPLQSLKNSGRRFMLGIGLL